MNEREIRKDPWAHGIGTIILLLLGCLILWHGFTSPLCQDGVEYFVMFLSSLFIVPAICNILKLIFVLRAPTTKQSAIANIFGVDSRAITGY